MQPVPLDRIACMSVEKIFLNIQSYSFHATILHTLNAFLYVFNLRKQSKLLHYNGFA